MKITFISDTHGFHEQLSLADSDLIVHAGDISKMGEAAEIQKFIDWFSDLPHPYKVFIGGNHDFLLEKEASLFRSMLNDKIIYLEDNEVIIEGIKIWGSPITPYFFNWAFNRQRGENIRKYWDAIPSDTDIIVTHGPPKGIGDKTSQGIDAGCADLLTAIERVKPRYHVFGHIHEAYGVTKKEATTFVNASCVNLKYQVVNAPITIDW